MSKESALEELRRSLVAGRLPAMPNSALSVLKLENDITKVNIDDIAKPIEADPGLAVQVLKFLNSSAFGFASTISNIRQGVALVGIRIVKNFVLWKAVFSMIPKSRIGNFDVVMLWQDSIRRGMFARFLLLESKKGDPEMAFAGALLQDMAIPLLMKVKPTEYSSIFTTLAKDPKKRLSELEEEFFNWNHADACLVLGQHWKLPEILVDLMSNHLKANEATSDFQQYPERAVVALTALMPSVTRPEWEEKAQFLSAFTKCSPGNTQLFCSMFDRVDMEFNEYASLLQIAQPKQLLFSYIDA